ncbi:hypothetical protein CRYUN_Cryun28dG0069200 [Craigia yunnanensis]
MVCRDSCGKVRCCAATRRLNVFSPLQAELVAIMFGLEIARVHGLEDIQIETDSLLAVQEIQKGYASACECDGIICYICDLLLVEGLGSVSYVRREAKYFAHNLAKLNVEGTDDVLWW